jgi:hypothetical protein
VPAFQGLAHYQPALVLLLGVTSFAGVLGIGFLVLRALGLRVPSPWQEVAAALLGTALLSLGVQLLAMLALATRPLLLLLWGAFALPGSLVVGLQLRGAAWRLPPLRGRGAALLAGMLVAALGIDLLLAMAPLTKMDELYYQVLPGARIALDGELVFYLRPYLAAVVPQMGYAIAGAPLHALGYVDAASVFSFCLGALLAWLVGRLVHEETGSPFTALLAAASVAVGLHPSVYYTTGGPHAVGDLATAAAVLALAFREKLLRACSAEAYVALLSLCCMMSAFSKVSLLPLAGIVLALGLVQTLRATRGAWLRIVGIAALPWLVFYVPLCVWTLVHSGSPFGPMLMDVFAPSVFDADVRGEMAASRVKNQGGALFALQSYVLNYPLVYAITLLAVLFLPGAVPLQRGVVAVLFLLQTGIVAILLPHQARFLSGLHQAVLAVGLILLQPRVRSWLARPLAPLAAVAVLLLPWLAAQAYRAGPLVPIALGLGDRETYYRSYIALYDDFRELDRVLPPDAVLYARNRLPSIYFPRPVYMHGRDLPAGRRAFAVLAVPEPSGDVTDCAQLRLPSGCRLGDPVYTNPEARFVVLRAPGDAPRTSRLEVREILPAAGEGRRQPRRG